MSGEVTIVSMFLLGLLGTGHCLGMCGPLALALANRPGVAQLSYHVGRIITYSLTGALMGWLGQGLSLVSRLQVGLSAGTGIILILLGLVRLGALAEPSWMSLANPAALPGFRTVQRRALHSMPALMATGLMLGLLPCGLSYAAFAQALSSGGPWPGALWTLAFGLGTLPGLLLLGTAASRLALRHRRLSDILSGGLMIAMGASLAVDALCALV